MEDAEPINEDSDLTGEPSSEESTQEPLTYTHDPGLVSVLAQLVDSACEDADTFRAVSINLRQLATSLNPPLPSAAERELVMTFGYSLRSTPIGSSRPDASLVPLDGPSYFPRSLNDADDQTRALWVDLASAVTHPVARARFADILFTLKLTENRRDAAERAIRAYLDTVGGSLQDHEQGFGLLRALTLARSVGLSDLEQQVASAMVDMAEGALLESNPAYVAVPLLDAIAVSPRKNKTQPINPKVDDLLDTALQAYAEAHVVKEVADIVRRRAAGDDARIQRASEAQIHALLKEADNGREALIKVYYLNEAASTARRYGVSHLEEVAVLRLQSAPQVEWKTLQTEFSIPSEIFRNYLIPYERAQTWQEALAYWFQSDSPSGSVPNNEETARNLKEVSVVEQIATTVKFGPEGFPKRVVSGEEDSLQRQRVRAASANIQLSGLLLASALDTIRARFGILSLEDVEACISDSGTHPFLAKALAKALQLYWVDEFAASVHLAVPKIEASARSILLELNEPVYRAAVGDADGQFPGLGSLLDKLEEKCDFDPDWACFLRVFLLKDGYNVRNLVAHGFMDEVDRKTAALALRACALVVVLASNEPAERDIKSVKDALAGSNGEES
ncbi:hypothetical protein F4561_001200 [Lipingzhangella halophila]|uniref:DUF7380 domain-containing protein n=1 Tax=Lipingzhangella halophila TaxID=1783352 RepID=A0A7W7REJ9_9ACTN|nr:DUF4209 domain-containing protein [Lipingzhangella halophila]MBB4930380.1 hypothetical protein [Lipingzhangella halophila]